MSGSDGAGRTAESNAMSAMEISELLRYLPHRYPFMLIDRFALRTLDQLPGDDSIYYFVGIDEARFRKPVVPGDRLDMSITPIRHARGIWKVNAEAHVAGALVAGAVLMGALREVAA